jgi:hypothetical protein
MLAQLEGGFDRQQAWLDRYLDELDGRLLREAG